MNIETINGSVHVVDEVIDNIEKTRAKHYGKIAEEMGKSKINELFHNDRLKAGEEKIRKQSEQFLTTGKMKIEGVNKPIVNLYHYLHESKRLNRKLHENSLKVMQSIVEWIKDNFKPCDLYDVMEVDDIDDEKIKIKKDRCIIIERLKKNSWYIGIKLYTMKKVTTPNGKVKKLPNAAVIHIRYLIDNLEAYSYSKFRLKFHKYDENEFLLSSISENKIDINDLLPLLKHLITEYIINDNYTEFH